jgi:hypothetical protein
MEMKRSFDIVIVMPVGPGTDARFVMDTIESYIHYSSHSYKFILTDDSQTGVGPAVKEAFPGADVLCTTKPMGGWAGLYVNLALAYRYAIEHYEFRLLLKLDTDALVIGEGFEQDAFNFFATHDNMGIAGQYPVDYNGNPWDRGWPRDRVLNGATSWKAIKRPIANITLRKLYLKAASNGYTAGESVFGGAYFMSRSLLDAFYNQGLLPHLTLWRLNLGEDHLFALLAKATGFRLGNMCSGNLPFGCAWKGLPAAPEELLLRQKKIIHSTRYWNNMDEEQVRDFFRTKRTKLCAS